MHQNNIHRWADEKNGDEAWLNFWPEPDCGEFLAPRENGYKNQRSTNLRTGQRGNRVNNAYR